MNYTQLVFEILLYGLIFYSVLCILFLLIISKLQYKVYKETVSKTVQPIIVQSLRQYDSNRDLLQMSKKYASKLNELSDAYGSPDRTFSNTHTHTALAYIGALICAFIVVPMFMLYTNGVVFPYREMFVQTLAFFGLFAVFGIFFYFLVISRYAPITLSQLNENIIESSSKLIN